MEQRTFSVTPSDAASHLPIIQALAERNNALTDQLGVLTVVLGIALRSNDTARLVTLAAIEAAREHGFDDSLLAGLRSGLTVTDPLPPKGGTHLRIVGGTEGPEAKAA
jgi:hypothetical protein